MESYAPLKSVSHTREGPIAFPERLHSAYILVLSENRTVDGPGAVTVRFGQKKGSGKSLHGQPLRLRLSPQARRPTIPC